MILVTILKYVFPPVLSAKNAQKMLQPAFSL